MRVIDPQIIDQLKSGELREFTLLHMTINSTDYYFTDCDVPIAYDGNLYMPRGFELGRISYSLDTVVDTAPLEIDNLDDLLTPDFVGSTPQGSPVTVSVILLDTDYLPVTSDELLINPGFDTDTDWTKGTGWTISGGRARCDHSSGVTDIYQSVAGMTEGNWYRVFVWITGYTSGGLAAAVGGAATMSWAAREKFYEIVQAGSADTNFALRGTDFVGDSTIVGLLEIIPPVTTFRGEIGQWQFDESKVSMTLTNQFAQWNQKTLRMQSSSCSWPQFKGTECGYTGAATSCDRTYARCEQLSNTANFGGERWLPSIEDKEVWWGRTQKTS